ncbi:MAG TPA: response regulator [Candidatus Saccharimonadales bacterium]|nr:response regulator [Candidatus Saccharimonadales bacterium]
MTDAASSPRLLLVDDDDALAEMYALRLTASGFDVTTAHSGAEALLMVTDRPPDLIYLDLGLPGMGGLEVLERLRKEPDTAGIPVVILTNFSEPGMLERGKSLGAQDYLIKVDTPPAQLAVIARQWLQHTEG